MNNPTFDHIDEQILARRRALFTAATKVQCGDFVEFPDGVVRRVSHIWEDGVQTSDNRFGGMSFYLGDEGVSYSGSLYTSVPHDSLTLEPRWEDGAFWFFHHDWAESHNGVQVKVPCRVWKCNLPAPD